MPVARVVQLASHLEQKRLADIAYETRRFVRIGESDVVINQRIADKSQPILKIYHYHCNHLGTPQELSDEKGDIVWLSYDRAWGGSFDSLYKQQFVDNFAISENELQPFKFQGQSLDTETGLHYNRFRYYDSDVGMFVSRDPIQLEGGTNTFAYAPNPTQWVDPTGLKKGDNAPRHGPNAVKRINNRLPRNNCFAGKTMSMQDIPKVMKEKYKGITGRYSSGVPFNMLGFPDFSRYAIKTIYIKDGFNTDYSDFKNANTLAFGANNQYKHSGTIFLNGKSYIWHHTEISGKMQLIPLDLHDVVKHTGGAAVCNTRS